MKKFSYCTNGGIMTVTCAVISVAAGVATVQPIRSEFCGANESWAANCQSNESCKLPYEDLQDA